MKRSGEDLEYPHRTVTSMGLPTVYVYLRLNFEIETREREIATVRDELELYLRRMTEYRDHNRIVAAEADDIVTKNIGFEKIACNSIPRGRKSPQLAGADAEAHVKFQFPITKDTSVAKADQRLLCSITANSTSMVEILTRFSEAEMSRTRNLDKMVEDAENRTRCRLEVLGEIADLTSQIQRVRHEYDSLLLDDFQVLMDLAQSVESLESELGHDRRKQKGSAQRRATAASKESRSIVVPMRESTIQLQKEVKALAEEVARLEADYTLELEKATRELTAVKSKKIQNKSYFQQSLKSVFKDLDILAERLDRGESTLEKINVHYQIGEEEIMSIVSPILETIDGVKERIQYLHSEADNYFYGNDGNSARSIQDGGDSILNSH